MEVRDGKEEKRKRNDGERWLRKVLVELCAERVDGVTRGKVPVVQHLIVFMST